MLTDPADDYARGYVPFLDCRIYLDSRPLIPRSETEYWVEKVIGRLSPGILRYEDTGNDSVLHCLDLFAGSGAIGVALLKHVPHAEVDFGEIDETHLPTIEKNIRENGISPSRTRVFKTDVWSDVSGRYDLILANPPYLSKSRSERVQESVTGYEPDRALFADNDGFALIERTILGAPQHLARHGELYIEHEPEHADRVVKTGVDVGFSVHVRKDQYGSVRYSVLNRP